MSERYLITGAAGFIGSQLMHRLQHGIGECLGIDNFNDHLYSPRLKLDRVKYFMLDVRNVDLRDQRELEKIIVNFEPTIIIHLAAHAGVRDSYGKEKQYHSNNIDGTQNLIDACKKYIPNVRIIYASTSSVYANSPLPFTEGNERGKQLNPYSWSKWTNECQFQSSGLNTAGLRFFTVYGPWGRPDMALFSFTDAILDSKEIKVYNFGDMKRDFTFIDDILDGIELVINNTGITPGEIFNIGRGEQVQLLDFVNEIEANVGKQAIKILAPKHPADALQTWSNTDKLRALGYQPKVSIKEGVSKFYQWYTQYKGGKLI